MRENNIVYEYASINVKSDLEPMYIDCYENFGWIHIKDVKKDYYINNDINQNIVNLKFKRNAKLTGKEELKILQEKYEKAFLKVNKLKKGPQSMATAYALIIGVVALIFITLSILAIVGEKIMWFPAILCGVIGGTGCIVPYFVYKNVKAKKEVENKTKIDEQQNIMYNACEQARNILLESD